MTQPLRGRTKGLSLEQLRKQAKELLRDYRAGDAAARDRFAVNGRPGEPVLADAQFVLAREHGFPTWAALKDHWEAVFPARLGFYQSIAADVLASCGGDGEALERLRLVFGLEFSGEQFHDHVSRKLDGSEINEETARLFVAKLFGFGAWSELTASAASAPPRRGDTMTPPFYRVNWKDGWIEARPPLTERDWEEIVAVIDAHGIRELRSAGQVTDAVLERIAGLDGLRRLQLEGSRRVTDEGLRHIARMERLESLNLTGCRITDAGLAHVRELQSLREFQIFHHRGISDAGLENLRYCPKLERVELLGSHSGDGTIRALAGKKGLRHFKSGDLLTDKGLSLLAEFPVFARWQGGTPQYSLMGFEAEPNYLLLRGAITDAGLVTLSRLAGLFGLNLDDSRLKLSSKGLEALAGLPHLEWLGFDATDETMAAIAALPCLRMLMCQDTDSSDAGWEVLGRSRSLQYIWGRRCYGLSDRGFRGLSRIPSLRGLSVSCKNVSDEALALLPDFPMLDELMPMDVPDAGFRHVGACARLEALWCMYCRDTSDAATEQLGGLRRLRSYYAGQTKITDRSLEILSRMDTLEKLEFWSCAGVTVRGVALLSRLPRLKKLTLGSMSNVSREVVRRFPVEVQVDWGD
ncbi:MAG: hypothetical protein JST93_29465 [Acidobacteria bacterium]|nr:hypothetical protein [Acidobacteriota bacterium]